jgi:hypothetical protein
MVEEKGPSACDAGPLKAESYNQHALFRASAFQSQPPGDVSAAAMDAVVVGIDPGALDGRDAGPLGAALVLVSP